jgi:hypothetical protein
VNVNSPLKFLGALIEGFTTKFLFSAGFVCGFFS